METAGENNTKDLEDITKRISDLEDAFQILLHQKNMIKGHTLADELKILRSQINE